VEFRPHDEIALWLKSADVLVLPNTGRQKVSLYYTSPMKLFEYMASGTPIVASSLPSILEILNKSNAVTVEPDNPKALAQGIEMIMNNKAFGGQIAGQAEKDVGGYTWLARADKITHYLNNHE